jgi:ribose transport system permease protein
MTATVAAPGRTGPEATPRRRRPDVAALVPWALLVLLVAVDGVLQPAALSLSNVGAVVFGVLPLVVVAIGQTLVVLTGGIDLSVAGVLSLTSALLATRATTDAQVLPWTLVCLALGALVGTANALCVVRLRMQPFIVTLGTWSIVGGIALLVLSSPGGAVPPSLTDLALVLVGGVPASLVILAGIVAGWLLVRRTRPVRHIYALGSDRGSAVLLGVRPGRTLLLTYVLSGLCAAVAGILFSAQIASGDPLGGNSYVLASVAAVVIGGARLAGGRGSPIGTVAGALITVYIADVVFATGLSSFWSPLIQGSLLIVAVLVGTGSRLLAARRIR